MAHELTHVEQQSGAGEVHGFRLMLQRGTGKQLTTTVYPEETTIFSGSFKLPSTDSLLDYSIELWNVPSPMLNDLGHKTELSLECQAGVRAALQALEKSNELPRGLPPLHLRLDAGYSKVFEKVIQT